MTAFIVCLRTDLFKFFASIDVSLMQRCNLKASCDPKKPCDSRTFGVSLSPGASLWGNVLKPLHIASHSFITLYFLCFPLFIFIHIATGKKHNCCQIVVFAGILLSAFTLRTLLRRYPVSTGFRMFLVSCVPLPRHKYPSLFQCSDDP